MNQRPGLRVEIDLPVAVDSHSSLVEAELTAVSK
jgi:hypothetical protein